MLWMGTWVNPYTVSPVQVGVDFWEIRVFPVGQKLIAPGMQCIVYAVIHKTRRTKRELHNYIDSLGNNQ